MKSKIAESLKPLEMPLALFLTVAAFSPPAPALQAGSNRAVTTRNAGQVYGRLPLNFEANRGQADARVRYLARGAGYAVSLTGNGAELAFYRPASQGTETDPAQSSKQGLPGRLSRTALLKTQARYEASQVRMSLDGAAAGASVTGEAPLQGTANYFVGNDPERWHTAIPTYGKVRYGGVYPGVDLVYYGSGQRALRRP